MDLPYPIPILFTHEDFIIVDKPIGIEMHSTSTDDTGIIGVLKRQVKAEQLFLVHRLDRDTSGCLIVAKNKSAAATLSKQFEQRQVSKFYLALLDKKPKKKQGSICGDMINRRKGQRVLLKTKINPAVTQFFTYSVKPGIRLAIVKPITGKTHQIRVALKSIAAPIIGDQRYGGSDADRLYLHALQVMFCYHDQPITCIAQPNLGQQFATESFKQCVQQIGAVENLPWP